ncbi:BTB/POZ domain-containing protein At3g56230-like [Tasmannia lanceolata]|uniref:BTB/POZ domain-containing protein At3g56230-like n=1 Tax=Tasmannia lanceolata TaxID=3420 RepID=UPI004063C246
MENQKVFMKKKKMDCCVCSPMASVFRPPRNTLCLSCYEGARSMMAFLDKLESETDVDKPRNSKVSQPNSTKGISCALKWMKEMQEMQKEENERMGFLEGFSAALRDELHSDVQIKPGDGPSIPAHRALLATKSEILRTMLECDECKTPPKDTISLPELSHEELRCLLEFLYRGTLPKEEVEKHVYSLLIAADKYEIPFLKKFCEREILMVLDSSNALEVLEVSEVCSNSILKESAMISIVKHIEDIVFSTRYDSFALKNASLCVEITRSLLREAKNRNCVQSSLSN